MAMMTPAPEGDSRQISDAVFALDSINGLCALQCDKVANAQVYLLKALLPFITEPMVLEKACAILKRRGAMH
jgi:hypothetical protein